LAELRLKNQKKLSHFGQKSESRIVDNLF